MPRIDPIHLNRMDRALELAKKALDIGEAPVGSIVVMDGEVVGEGFNQVEKLHDPTAHAEIIAIKQASERLQDWRLNTCAIYVTLEPCVMCAGAVLHSRIPRLFFGAYDIRWGAFGTLLDLSHDPRLNHEIEVISGLREDESMNLLQGFFKTLRK